MTPVRLVFPFLVAVLVMPVLMAERAAAMLGECMVTVTKEQHDQLADKTEARLRDSAEHREFHITFRGKTFGELQPGDVVDAHGEPHMLHEVTHRTDWSRYTFIKQSDLDRHAERLNSPDRDSSGRDGSRRDGSNRRN